MSNDLFAEWYAEQKGLVKFGERLNKWKTLRDQILLKKPKISFVVATDQKTTTGAGSAKLNKANRNNKANANKKGEWFPEVDLTITWPKELKDLHDIHYEVGLVWQAQRVASNLPDEDGDCTRAQRFYYEDATFWQTTYEDVLRPNQYIQEHKTKIFTIQSNSCDVIHIRSSEAPSKLVIKVSLTSTDDTLTLFEFPIPSTLAAKPPVLATETMHTASSSLEQKLDLKQKLEDMIEFSPA